MGLVEAEVTYYEVADAMLEERLAKIIPRYSMFAPGNRVGVAVSGGADSVVLLHLLKRVKERFGLTLIVLHVNHRLRGGESEGDEEFVRELARLLDLEFLCERMSPGKGNLEQEARQKRLAFYRTVRASHGLGKVALGHTQSDQAETVLLRLFRGAGLSGMAGMRFVSQNFLVRPLLSSTREEVRAWAKAESVAWRDDSSNSDRRFSRNRLRLETLPKLIRTYNPRLESVLASTAELAQAEEDDWTERVEATYRLFAKRTRLGSFLQIADLRKMSVALQRRVIRRALQDVREFGLRGLDFEHIEAIRGLLGSCEGHDRVMVPGADALRSYDTLLLAIAGKLASEQRGYEVRLGLSGWQILPNGAGRIYVSHVKPEDSICASFKEDQAGVSEWAELSFEDPGAEIRLTVRNWEPGDRILRPGHTSAVKTKTLFQDHRILLWERRHWPTVRYEGQIVWIRRFGVAQQFSQSTPNGKKVWLVYLPETNGVDPYHPK